VRRTRWIARAFALAAAAAVVAFCQSVGSPERAGAAPSLRLQKVGNFAEPTYVAGAPGFKQLLYVVEQDGKVVVLRSGHRLSKPLLDISGRVSCCGERGLFSIAFDPRFANNHLLYAYYTNRQGSIEIDEFRAPLGTRVVQSSRRKVIVIPHPGQSNHNGGQLQFGPDGYLYAGTGDGGGSGDTGDNARQTMAAINQINYAGEPTIVAGDLRYDRSPAIEFAEARMPRVVEQCPRWIPAWRPPRADLLAPPVGSPVDAPVTAPP